MTGLLDLKVNRDGINLDCWLVGGEYRRLKPPCLPYFFTSTVNPAKPPAMMRLLGECHSRPFEKVEKREVWTEQCSTVYGIEQRRDLVVGMEDNVRFIERLCIDYGFENLVVPSDLSVVGFDIECESKSGQFPNPKNEFDPLTAFSVFGNCSDNSRTSERCFTGDESDILKNAVEEIQWLNPDVLCTYSGTGIDYEYPLVRAHVLGRAFRIGRQRDEPFIARSTYRRKFFERTETTTYLKGRLCMDVYNEVLVDTSLTGLRRTLKVVGRHFFAGQGFDIVEEDRMLLKQLSPAQLSRYCLSDARLAYHLGMHYLGAVCSLARKYSVPLSAMVHRKPSHTGNLIYGRGFRELGIVSDGSNRDRLRDTR